MLSLDPTKEHTHLPEKPRHHRPVEHRNDPEVVALAESIKQQHRNDVSRLACLVFMAQRVSFSETAWPPGLRESLVALQRELTECWMSQKGITGDELRAALASLERAEATVQYLDSLPS